MRTLRQCKPGIVIFSTMSNSLFFSSSSSHDKANFSLVSYLSWKIHMPPFSLQRAVFQCPLNPLAGIDFWLQQTHILVYPMCRVFPRRYESLWNPQGVGPCHAIGRVVSVRGSSMFTEYPSHWEDLLRTYRHMCIIPGLRQ